MEPFTQAEQAWTDPAGGNRYLLRITHAIIDGRAEVVAVEMWGITPPEKWLPWKGTLDTPSAVTSSVLRLPLRRISVGLLDDVRTHWAPLMALSRSERVRQVARTALSSLDHRRGRPPLYGPEHWRTVADTYLAATRAPSKAVAEQFAVSRGVARKWVARCRREGLLTP